MKNYILVLIMILTSSALFSNTLAVTPDKTAAYRSYSGVIQKTAWMASDGNVQTLAQKYGLQVLNVTWEDTGRYKGSSVGPNISDMTIQVQQQDPATKQYRLTCMPVIRYPNYADLSADIDPGRFYILVGNETGKPLKRLALTQYLD
ncbi:MAG TPA: hypothetical protein PKN50_20280, partial [Spirochaetota bacterium]|nr:hypothetical protein [Spirochaetota bacterium]